MDLCGKISSTPLAHGFVSLLFFGVHNFRLICCIRSSLNLTDSNTIESWPWHSRVRFLYPATSQPLIIGNRTQTDVIYFSGFYWVFLQIIKKSLEFCWRATLFFWTAKTLIPGLNFINDFPLCCALCPGFERGSKNKRTLEQPVSAAYQTYTFMLFARVCLSFLKDFYRRAKHRTSSHLSHF